MAKKTVKKKSSKKKSQSWETIGKNIGKKVETDFKKKDWSNCCCSSFRPVHDGGGFVGRLLFVIGILYAMSYAGWFANVPTWPIVMMGFGFALMKL